MEILRLISIKKINRLTALIKTQYNGLMFHKTGETMLTNDIKCEEWTFWMNIDI